MHMEIYNIWSCRSSYVGGDLHQVKHEDLLAQ